MAVGEATEFDIMRQRVREREQEKGKQATEAVKGQFASRGLLQSGAQVKAQQQAARQVAEQARLERQDIRVAEADVRRREQEAQRGRQFARQERLGQEQFARGQAEAQRGFLTQERVAQNIFAAKERAAAETFAAAQAKLGRNFTAAESKAIRDFQEIQADLERTAKANLQTTQLNHEQSEAVLNRALQQAGLDQNKELAEAALEVQKSQFAAELAESQKAAAVNMATSMKNSGFTNNEIVSLANTLGIDLSGLGLTVQGAPIAPLRTSTPGTQPDFSAGVALDPAASATLETPYFDIPFGYI